MDKIVNVNGMQYKINSDIVLDSYQEKLVIDNLMNMSSDYDITSLSPASCPGPVLVGTTRTLTATASNGTPPYHYHWSVRRPDNVVDTPIDSYVVQYQFTQTGSYTISLYVTDTCPTGSMTSNTDSCSVTVVSCVVPVCSFTMSQT
jgi:hypothetical protein